MMQTSLLMKTAPIGCALMIAGCAISPPTSAAPPRLALPVEAVTPCRLAVLPEAPTRQDLETAYALRGTQLLACDMARRMAVEALMAEREMQDRLMR
jgi:hypothetical protein